MYPGIPYSPQAFITAAIGAADTIIPVDKIDAFPPAPNLAVIGSDESAETIRYAAKTDSALSGCTRGVEGTAREWQAGEVIARNFTSEDLTALQENLRQIDTEKASKVTGAVAGNLAGLSAGGNLVDSGKRPTDFAAANHTHTASDVGARPADWMPTAAQVGARPDTWLPTAADVGADPAGSAAAVDSALTAHKQDAVAHMTQAQKGTLHTHTNKSVLDGITAEKVEVWDNPTTAEFHTVSLPASGWTGNGPYTQAVSVAGILATDRPIFGPVYAGTNDEKIEQSIMAGFVSSCETAAGSVTFTALLAKPEVDLTMQLEVIR